MKSKSPFSAQQTRESNEPKKSMNDQSTPSVLDQLEAQKADIEKKIKAAKHAVWMLDVDLKAVIKKIEATKEFK